MMYDVVLLSGGFDPAHVGHVRMVRSAAMVGRKVVIGVNSDEWLSRKKGYSFMSLNERKEIMGSFAGVYMAKGFDDGDDTACGLLMWARAKWPTESIAFGNGGDRNIENVPEQQVADELNIGMIWNLGGGKVQSSSTLVKESRRDK
jgi:cytidyltransferase-like protein